MDRGAPARHLVLSIFPGIDLLGRGFEEEFGDEICLVRGPDPIFGSDIRGWHVPAGVFWGVLGGDPCQPFSRLNNINKAKGIRSRFPDMTSEFARVVDEGQPAWFLRENVPGAPDIGVPGYVVHRFVLNNHWLGGTQNRLRIFWFGARDGRRLDIEILPLENPIRVPAMTASGTRWVPIKLNGSGKIKSTYEQQRHGRPVGVASNAYFREGVVAQGLPEDFDLPDFTVRGKIRAVGNGVSRDMARAIAKAIRKAMEA